MHDTDADLDGVGGEDGDAHVGDDDEASFNDQDCDVVSLPVNIHCSNFQVWFPGSDSEPRGTLCFYCSGIKFMLVVVKFGHMKMFTALSPPYSLTSLHLEDFRSF